MPITSSTISSFLFVHKEDWKCDIFNRVKKNNKIFCRKEPKEVKCKIRNL